MKLWLWFLTFLWISQLSASILELNEGFNYTKASPYMSYYKDVNHTLTFETIEKAEWKPLTTTNLGGHNTFSSWTTLSLKNNTLKPMTLLLKNPRACMDEIDIYVKRYNQLAEHHLGDTRPLVERLMPHRYGVIPLINVQPNEEIHIITRLYNPIGATEAEWEVYERATFVSFALKDMIWWGIFIGINLALFLYCVPILIVAKDRYLALLLAFFTASSITHQLSTNGILYSIGYYEQALNLTALLSGLFFVLSTTLLILHFLKITHHNGPLRIIFRAVFGLTCSVLGLSLVSIFYPSLLRITSITMMGIGLIGFLSWFLLLKNFIPLLKDSIFRYIFIGYTTIFITFIYQLLIIFGLLQSSSFSIYSFSIGSTLQMYFFALGIANYMKMIEKEKREKDALLDFQMRFASIGRVVGNISHQWKVPLVRASALLTHIEAILHFKQKDFYPKIEALVPEIRSYFDFMQHSIDEFYTLYSKNTSKTEFALSPVIHDVWKMLSSKVSSLHATLTINDPHSIKLCSFEYSLAHVFIILIDNALDSAREHKINQTHITISVYELNDNLEIILQDNCGGIKQQPIESIFDIDVSSKQKLDAQGGLGLAIVKTLMNEKFYGEIFVKNTPEGARFSLRFPKDIISSQNLA